MRRLCGVVTHFHYSLTRSLLTIKLFHLVAFEASVTHQQRRSVSDIILDRLTQQGIIHTLNIQLESFRHHKPAED